MNTTLVCRIYQRISTSGQDLTRQDALRAEVEAKGYMVAATYSEKASGASEDRPELLRMLADLDYGDIIFVEHLNCVTQLPLDKAEALVSKIHASDAKVSVPGLIDLPAGGEGLSGIVIDSMQAMLLKIAVYQCRADYETRRARQRQGIELAKARGVYKGRKPDMIVNAKILELRAIGYTISKIASTLCVSESQVKVILKKNAVHPAA